MSKQIIYTNQVKYKRAEEIVVVLRGEKKSDEVETIERFKNLVAEADLDLAKDDVVGFVYEKLGGLVTTQEELEKRKAKVVGKKASKGRKKVDEDDGDDE